MKANVDKKKAYPPRFSFRMLWLWSQITQQRHKNTPSVGVASRVCEERPASNTKRIKSPTSGIRTIVNLYGIPLCPTRKNACVEQQDPERSGERYSEAGKDGGLWKSRGLRWTEARLWKSRRILASTNSLDRLDRQVVAWQLQRS